MAIDTGLAIQCADLQSTGGITQICLRSFAAGDTATVDATADTHGYSSIGNGGGTASWFVYEFKNETPTLNITATKENGSTAFECALSFSLPRMNDPKFHELQKMLNECMMAIVTDTNGTNFVVGLSERFRNEDVLLKNQTFLNLAGMEGTTGAAYSDENMITINLVARQFELPRLYSGTLTVDTSALTATTT
mgnify:CR=1 FL=1|tara:strand:+ start:181 stop:759 length:579 start_codon:yes stop_codon:yes gene_type:complete